MKYPDFQDNIKRICTVFFLIVIIVVCIDVVGGLVLSLAFGDAYHPLERFKLLALILVVSTMVTAIYEAIYLYVQLGKTIREEEQAKQVLVQAELDALRNQAQPHFLFNSFNTLRDIIDQNPKEDAREFVDKLSSVYRFILESGNEHLTVLRDELKFAKSYIHIQSERFGNNLRVNWNVPDSVLDRMVVPMSLQLLLENAIKHNVISRTKPLVIDIKIDNDRLIVENIIQLKTTKLPSTKLGLENIKKRYTLISKKDIEVKNCDGRFIVSLPLLKPSDQKINYAVIDY